MVSGELGLIGLIVKVTVEWLPGNEHVLVLIHRLLMAGKDAKVLQKSTTVASWIIVQFTVLTQTGVIGVAVINRVGLDTSYVYVRVPIQSHSLAE